jgi:hypothetical protein
VSFVFKPDRRPVLSDAAIVAAEFEDEFPELRARDRIANCAKCGEVVIHPDDAYGRPVRKLPPMVATRAVTDAAYPGHKRPYCLRCARFLMLPTTRPATTEQCAMEVPG